MNIFDDGDSLRITVSHTLGQYAVRFQSVAPAQSFVDYKLEKNDRNQYVLTIINTNVPELKKIQDDGEQVLGDLGDQTQFNATTTLILL